MITSLETRAAHSVKSSVQVTRISMSFSTLSTVIRGILNSIYVVLQIESSCVESTLCLMLFYYTTGFEALLFVEPVLSCLEPAALLPVSLPVAKLTINLGIITWLLFFLPETFLFEFSQAIASGDCKSHLVVEFALCTGLLIIINEMLVLYVDMRNRVVSLVYLFNYK